MHDPCPLQIVRWVYMRDAQVALVQRNFIELLVQKGLFARQLSALREVDSMLRHVEALKGDEHDQLLQARRLLNRSNASSPRAAAVPSSITSTTGC